MKASTSTLHPHAEISHQLWQVFVDNVHPLTKMVHVPTLEPALKRAMFNTEQIPRGFEALMVSPFLGLSTA